MAEWLKARPAMLICIDDSGSIPGLGVVFYLKVIKWNFIASCLLPRLLIW